MSFGKGLAGIDIINPKSISLVDALIQFILILCCIYLRAI